MPVTIHASCAFHGRSPAIEDVDTARRSRSTRCQIRRSRPLDQPACWVRPSPVRRPRRQACTPQSQGADTYWSPPDTRKGTGFPGDKPDKTMQNFRESRFRCSAWPPSRRPIASASSPWRPRARLLRDSAEVVLRPKAFDTLCIWSPPRPYGREGRASRRGLARDLRQRRGLDALHRGGPTGPGRRYSCAALSEDVLQSRVCIHRRRRVRRRRAGRCGPVSWRPARALPANTIAGTSVRQPEPR